MERNINIKEYYTNVPEDRKIPIQKLLDVIKANIPEGVEEGISYGFPAFVVPHSVYPKGYHCKPEEPLPFIGIGSMKHYIAFHAFCVYTNDELTNWFKEEYKKVCKTKLDMGKSCIRFKKMDDIPYELIGQLIRKIDLKSFIDYYESNLRK